jgi:putative DNA primase/helicase
MRYQQDFYRYKDGIWQALKVEDMESLIHHEIGPFSCNYNINEIKNAIIRESLVAEEIVDQKQDKYIVAVNNGMLDVRTKQLKEFQEEYYAFKKMRASFDPKANCPMFKAFIDELFKNDVDAEDKKKLVQEIIGYLLIPDYTLVKKMFYFFGSKADNGKSSLIEIIRNVFGPGYFDSVPMDKLDGFLLKKLKGNHANIVGDQNAHTRVPDGIIKLLIGGLDDITADVKHKEAINFVNTARLIFAVNRLPYSEAKDEGYFTRTVIVTFNNQFIVNPDPKNPRQMKVDSEKIQLIKEHEKKGILNWMLEGLERLLTNKRLTAVLSSDTALEAYKRSNSSVLMFVNEECELNPAYMFNRQDLYDHYKSWCTGQGFQRYVNAHTFYDTIIREFDVKEHRTSKERFLKGIQLA